MSERVIRERETTRDCDLCAGPMDAAPRKLRLSPEASAKLHANRRLEERSRAVVTARVWIEGYRDAIRVDDICAACLGPMLRKLERVVCYGEAQ